MLHRINTTVYLESELEFDKPNIIHNLSKYIQSKFFTYITVIKDAHLNFTNSVSIFSI